MTVTLHVSHKQEPEDVLNVVKRFLKKDISVIVQPSNAKASKQILKEIETQGINQVDIQKQVIRINPEEKQDANNSGRTTRPS